MLRAEEAAERALRRFAAAMIGELAHDLNNRLATMRETVGLLEDLAQAGRAGAAGSARAQAALDDQVGRALNLVRTLGQLGVAIGAGAGSFDAGAAIGDLAAMAERWARRQSLRLEIRVAPGLPRAAGDPAIFLCLAHRLIARSAEGLQPGGVVALQAAREGAAVRVHLSLKGDRAGRPPASSADEDETDRELARRLRGDLSLEGGDGPTIRLAAPP